MATEGKALMERTLQLADRARTRIAQIPGLCALQPEQATTPGFCKLDRTRLTVTVSGLGISGFTADEFLHQRGVTAELPSLQHLTFIISLGNTIEDIDRLVQGFEQLADREGNSDFLPIPHPPIPPSPHPSSLLAKPSFPRPKPYRSPKPSIASARNSSVPTRRESQF